MDNSSALPAAAAAHLGAMARVPASALPVDFSPGDSGDFAALLAAQPGSARAPTAPPIIRAAAGNDTGRGGSLPDSGKGLPSGSTGDRPGAAAEAEARSAARGANAATAASAAGARREARAAAADEATSADAAAAADEAEGEGTDECDAEARNARLARARLEATTAGVADPVPTAATATAAANALAALAGAAGVPGDAATLPENAGTGGECTDGDAALAASGGRALGPDATASLAERSGQASGQAPGQTSGQALGAGAAPGSVLGRMIAAARESGAGGDGVALQPLAEANAAAEPMSPGTAGSVATAAAQVLAGTGEGEALRGRHEAKPTAPASVRLDGQAIAAADTTSAADAGGAAARQGHRESPTAAPLPGASPRSANQGQDTGVAAAAAASPAPTAAPAPPAGLSALAANAAVAAMRGAAAGGRRGEGLADAALSATGSVSAANGEVLPGVVPSSPTASSASPAGLLAGLVAGLAPPPGSAIHSPRAAVEVQAAPGTPAFADELAERVAVLVQQDAGGATLKLNPGHLGPVEVRVQVRDGEATVMFAAHHATTREALEGAAPRLRELLGQQGYTQVNVDVAAQGQDLAQRQAAWNQARADGSGGRDGRGPWREAAAGKSDVAGLQSPGTRAAAARGAGRLDAFA